MKRLTAFFSLLLSAALLSASERILIVVTNHQDLGDTGNRTGYYLSEVAHPWQVFTDAGYRVEFASPEGGYAPMDPKSFDLEDPINAAFWETLEAVEGVVATQSLAEVDASDYRAIFFAGGHGTMWDFAESDVIARQVSALYGNGGVVGAVCHGPAALIGVEVDGRALVAGRRVTGFTNEEEAAVQLTETMPFLLETRLRELGADFEPAANFAKNVVVDGRLVTGQNPASATGAAQAIVELLSD
jgi:putative intracellular protease/amidase